MYSSRVIGIEPRQHSADGRRGPRLRIAKEQPLSKEESDKAVRVARVTAMAEQVFGEPQPWHWLRKPKPRFEGKAPLEMLATEAGALLLEEMIVQIGHGIFVLTVWRISNHATLDGGGGLRASGRSALAGESYATRPIRPPRCWKRLSKRRSTSKTCP